MNMTARGWTEIPEIKPKGKKQGNHIYKKKKLFCSVDLKSTQELKELGSKEDGVKYSLQMGVLSLSQSLF